MELAIMASSSLCFASSSSIKNIFLRRQQHHFLSSSSSSSSSDSSSSSRLFYSSRMCKLNDGRCFSPKNSVSKIEVEGDINDNEACELVNGVEISIGEGVDSINAQIFTAVKNNNRTGILLLSDIFGFQDSYTRDFAYRIACNGYNVLVPDLFRGDPWAKERPKTMFEEWISKQEPERIAKDISTSTQWLVDELMAAGISKKLGIIGFCFGGGIVIDVLAKDKGAVFGTGTSFYGTRIDLSQVTNIEVPVLLVTGDSDPLCPVDVMKELEGSLGSKGSKLVVFEGRGQGFVHRPQSYEEDKDAEQAFMLLRNWLHNGLFVNS